MIENILFWWVLPSLLTALFMISYLRVDDILLSDFDTQTSCHFLLIVVIYPATWYVLLQEEVWPRLVRRFGQ
jgi:hypothetical protein